MNKINDIDFYKESYFKHNEDCPYRYKIFSIRICAWNNLPCERVPFELCESCKNKEENTNE